MVKVVEEQQQQQAENNNLKLDDDEEEEELRVNAVNTLMQCTKTSLDVNHGALFSFFHKVFFDGKPVPISELWRLMGKGQCTTRCFKKPLETTDVTHHQGRLLIQADFAIKQINKKLLRNSENIEEGVQVTVYDYWGKEYTMYYKLWAGKSHVIKTGWNEFRIKNKLNEEHEITLWGFRRPEDDRLCFVITWEVMSAERIRELQENKKNRKGSYDKKNNNRDVCPSRKKKKRIM